MSSNKIHIVFGVSAKNTLLSSKEMSDRIDAVISLNDDLRVGPIFNLGKSDSRLKRQDWLTSTMPCQEVAASLGSDVSSDFDTIQNIKAHINNKTEIFIWCGRTTSDRLATARLVYELQDAFEHLRITDIPNITIQSKFGHNYPPKCLGVMNPEEVHLITEYFKKITKQECDMWSSIWTRLENETGLIRVGKANGKIESEDVSYFDELLLSNCKEHFLQASRIVGETLIDIGFEASDSTLNWRLVCLAKNKKLEFEGKLNGLNEYKVKRATK